MISLKSQFRMLARIALFLLVLIPFSLTASSVYAFDSHQAINNSGAMSRDMIHQHIMDCPASCGYVNRIENRKYNAQQQKKKKVEEPNYVTLFAIGRNHRNDIHKYREVFHGHLDNLYIRNSQLRF